MFEVFTVAILVTVLASVVWAVYRLNDTLHPLVYLMPMAAYLYVWLPYGFYSEGVLLDYFTPGELGFVQGFNFACVAALALGCLKGGRGLKRDKRCASVHAVAATPAWRKRIFYMGLILGGAALLLYVYGLLNVGGLYEAYDTPKGGGHASSGYLRDFKLLVVPAIVMVYMSKQGKRWTWGGILLVVVLSFPLLLRGFLTARRGPTFVAVATLVVGWYLTRRRRPSLYQVLGGGAALGLGLLMLVTFRGQIYLGSSFFSGEGPSISEMVERTLENDTEASYENEFIYGTYVVVDAYEHNFHHWGTRYLTNIFVRPIPSQLWPTKYRDVGMEVMLSNGGMLRGGADAHPYVPPGAAPGFASGFFVEFSWGGVLAAFLLGWFYGFMWRRCLTRGGLWTILYVTMIALSVYLIVQSLNASLFRFLEVLLPTILAWRYFEQHDPAVCERRAALNAARRSTTPSLGR